MEKLEKEYSKGKHDDVTVVRIFGKDILGNIKVHSALTKISGISWSFTNVVCKVLKLNKNQRIQDVNKESVTKIEEFIKNPQIPSFLKNRQKDLESGEDKHLAGADLKLRKEFDIKRLKKIKSYRGIRHGANLPVRGQRTKGNFRRNRKKSVVATKKKK